MNRKGVSAHRQKHHSTLSPTQKWSPNILFTEREVQRSSSAHAAKSTTGTVALRHTGVHTAIGAECRIKARVETQQIAWVSTYPLYKDTNLTGCQVNKLILLRPVGEILGTCGVENVHLTLEDLDADELLLAHSPFIVGHKPSAPEHKSPWLSSEETDPSLSCMRNSGHYMSETATSARTCLTLRTHLSCDSGAHERHQEIAERRQMTAEHDPAQHVNERANTNPD